MRKGGGKEKGNQFERWVHKELSKWIGFEIKRNSDSGSITKRDNTIIPGFPFTLELKFHKLIPMANAVYNHIDNTEIWKWYLQAKEGIHAKYMKPLIPVVIAKGNAKPPVCFISGEDYDKLTGNNIIPPVRTTFYVYNVDSGVKYLHMFLFSDLLVIPYSEFKCLQS